MNTEKRKIILLGLAFGVVVLLVILFALLKSNKEIGKKEDRIKNPETLNLQDIKKEEEKKIEEVSIEGKIVSVSASDVKISSEDQNEILEFKIPKKNVVFLREEKKEDGTSSYFKELGLFDIAKESSVEVRYNKETNEVMEVIVE